MAVGYGLAFQQGDDRQVKKVLNTFINGGFIKAQLSQNEKKKYDTWLKQMGQYIYDTCPTSEYEFNELVVLHEISNVRRVCKQSEAIKTLLVKAERFMTKEQLNKMEIRALAVDKIQTLNYISRVVIEDNGLQDSDFQTKFEMVIRILKDFENLAFGQTLVKDNQMYDEAQILIGKLSEDAKQKMTQSLNLEASRLQTEQARKDAETKRAANKKYDQCIKFLIKRFNELSRQYQEMEDRGMKQFQYAD